MTEKEQELMAEQEESNNTAQNNSAQNNSAQNDGAQNDFDSKHWDNASQRTNNDNDGESYVSKETYSSKGEKYIVHQKEGSDNEEAEEDDKYLRLSQEVLETKKKVSWKGSAELISMREIEPYDSASTSPSTHDTIAGPAVLDQDLGGTKPVHIYCSIHMYIECWLN